MPFDTVRHFIQEQSLANSSIIVALSGGPDSVFLLHALCAVQKEFNLTIIAAHLDHQWRTQSADDVAFCKQLTTSLHVPFVHTTMATLNHTIKWNGSKEEYARHARKHFLHLVAQKHTAASIATAHHAQDQEETFFIRLIRGASLTGLCSIRPKQGLYIRPLLTTSKTTILAYLETNAIAYLTDSTNLSNNFLRNRLRNTALPALKSTDSRFERNFAHTMSHLVAVEHYLEEQTASLYRMIAHINNDTLELDIAQLHAIHPMMQQRILLHWLVSHKVQCTPSQRLFNEISRFLKSSRSKNHRIHALWSIKKRGTKAVIVLHTSSINSCK